MNKQAVAVSAICTALILTGCGSSSEPTTEAASANTESETTETYGVITGFGSVFVNGVEYETDSTAIEIDDNPAATEDDLQVGMVVSLSGRVHGDGERGDAFRIHYSESIKGPVGSIDLSNNQLTILGQTVNFDELTTLESIVLDELNPGDFLEISGFINSDGEFYATRIEKQDGITDLKLKGKIDALDLDAMTFMLNELVIDYSQSEMELENQEALADGLSVKVKGDLENLVDGVFTISKLKLDRRGQSDGSHQQDSGTRRELEGFIDGFVSAAEFTVNGIAVVTDETTYVRYGTLDDLALNSRVKIKGHVNDDGLLLADIIRIHQRTRVSVEGAIEAIDADANTITVMGLAFLLTHHTKLDDDSLANVRYFDIADLAIGDYVEVKGFITDAGNYIATKLERDDETDLEEEGAREIHGEVTAITDNGFTVMGIPVITSEQTLFQYYHDQMTTQQGFFEMLEPGMFVEVKGNAVGEVFVASKVELKNEPDEEHPDNHPDGRFVELKGVLEDKAGSELVVSGRTLQLQETTHYFHDGQLVDGETFLGQVSVGDFIKVKGFVDANRLIKVVKIISYQQAALKN